MRNITGNASGTLIALIVLFFPWNCSKDDDSIKVESGFVLSSPEIGSDSLLPADYTCDGESSTLPLKWTGAPPCTVSFALIMHHETSPNDIHCYWIMYDIPESVDSLPINVSGIGILGINSLNDMNSYSPPCSQGPGMKDYTFTVYALSQKPVISVSPGKVDRATMLNAIKDITISSAKMRVYYSRNLK
jgi:phosphatidylethanolamine-binding protein (PEBP) family uncharacterized protein